MAAQRALYYFRVARKMAMRFKLGTLIRSESHCLSAFESLPCRATGSSIVISGWKWLNARRSNSSLMSDFCLSRIFMSRLGIVIHSTTENLWNSTLQAMAKMKPFHQLRAHTVNEQIGLLGQLSQY